MIPESRREASLRTTDKFDLSKPRDQQYLLNWARPPFLASNQGTHKRFLFGSLNSRLRPIPMTHPSALDLLYVSTVCVLVYCCQYNSKQKCRQVQNNCVSTVGCFAVVGSMRENGILQKQCCCMRETGDKVSCRSVRATVIPQSQREVSIHTIDKFDISKPAILWKLDSTTGDAVPSQQPRHTLEILRGSLNSRLIKCRSL